MAKKRKKGENCEIDDKLLCCEREDEDMIKAFSVKTPNWSYPTIHHVTWTDNICSSSTGLVIKSKYAIKETDKFLVIGHMERCCVWEGGNLYGKLWMPVYNIPLDKGKVHSSPYKIYKQRNTLILELMKSWSKNKYWKIVMHVHIISVLCTSDCGSIVFKGWI